MNNTQKVLKNQHICEQATPNLGITQSSGLDHHAIAELYQETVGALCRGDEKGAGNQYVSQNKCIVNPPTAKVGLLIRRLTPLECERLQGFPDGWTNIPGASDSARYKALGNSVAIPCVEFVMRGIAITLKLENEDCRRQAYWKAITVLMVA